MWNRSIAVSTASLFLVACSSGGPVLRSQSTGDLAPCGSAPCVSSQDTREKHFIEPMRYAGQAVAAREKLGRVLKRMQGMGYTVVTNEGDYLHATHAGGRMGAAEDLEFVFSQSQRGLIHVRSASRSGYADFGSNREHVEEVRRAFDVAKN